MVVHSCMTDAAFHSKIRALRSHIKSFSVMLCHHLASHTPPGSEARCRSCACESLSASGLNPTLVVRRRKLPTSLAERWHRGARDQDPLQSKSRDFVTNIWAWWSLGPHVSDKGIVHLTVEDLNPGARCQPRRCKSFVVRQAPRITQNIGELASRRNFFYFVSIKFSTVRSSPVYVWMQTCIGTLSPFNSKILVHILGCVLLGRPCL